MCGIAVVADLNNQSPIPLDELLAMLGAIRHRGPDQFGIYTFQDEHSAVGLANARLSIIDLARGQQPISNEDSTLWIVFNGEIFNYIELRQKLEQRRHRFATESDTEVILHLYEEFGPECVHHLNGEFAFAIWNERTRTLFMARDRLGIRPLYYTVKGGVLIAASEVKGILAGGRVTAMLDPVTLDQIFTYWSPLAPRTIFQKVHSLPPGHWLFVDPAGHFHSQCYWQPSFPLDNPCPSISFDDAVHHFRHLLVDAIQIRLRADVPVGAYLSGGLDSSAVASLVRRYTNNQLETFSVAFADDTFDESIYQNKMAQFLDTPHHVVTCTHADIGHAFPTVIWHTETPILRTSPTPLFLLSQLVRDRGFKVVLTGEGADEFLAGYNIFKEANIRRFWAKQPDSSLRPLLLKKLYPYINHLSNGKNASLRMFFGQNLLDIDTDEFSHAIRWRNTSRVKRFYSHNLKSALAKEAIPGLSLPANFRLWHPLARAQFLEIAIFMEEYLLTSQGDRVAMAHSVEGRLPFLDHRVIEFCNQLPPTFKLRGLDEKRLLKHAVRDLLPDAIRQRPKRPYRAPIYHSFFPGGQPLDWVKEVTSMVQIEQAGYFDPQAVMHLLGRMDRREGAGESDNMALTGILSVQLVHQQFFSNFQVRPPVTNLDNLKVVIRGQTSELA